MNEMWKTFLNSYQWYCEPFYGMEMALEEEKMKKKMLRINQRKVRKSTGNYYDDTKQQQ